MNTIKTQTQENYIINKSKFISIAYPVSNECQIKDILEGLAREYSDATHICYAYVLSSPRLDKCSDNGEPAGTAGKPILELIKKKNLENILVVVIRYFGGIKLGAGGLVRAYTTSAKLAIDASQIVEYIWADKCQIECSLKDGNDCKHYLETIGAEIINVEYSNTITITFLIDKATKINKDYNVKVVGSEMLCL